MKKYQVITYIGFDKNEEGSWVINELERDPDPITVTDSATLKDLCNYLSEIGFLPSSDLRVLQVTDFDSDIIEFKRKKGSVPIGRLEKLHY